MIIQINKNEPICGCDGAITIYATYGYPPYTYSIDNGITFRNGPIFDNLCSGLYSVLVADTSGNTFSSTINLETPPLPIQYNISFNQNSRVVSDNGITKVIQNDVTLSVSPELPDSAYITFDLLHTNILKTSPTFNAASLTTNTTLLKNEVSLPLTTSGSSTGTTFNTYPGCQDKDLFVITYSEVWSGLEINSSDNYSLATISSLTQNVSVECYYSDNLDSYQVSNLKINNCSCCSVGNI